MGWINKQIAKVAPGFALKREIAARRLQMLDKLSGRSIEAGLGGRRNSGYIRNNKSADSSMEGAEDARFQVRQLEQNNGFVSGPILRIVNNVVGSGFQLQARVKPDRDKSEFPAITETDAETYNSAMEKKYNLWCKKADKRLILNFSYILRCIEASLLRDGAVIAVGRKSERSGRVIPYCLDLYEIDRLRTPMSEWKNPKIRNGIKYDYEGVPETYYILKEHPGNSINRSMLKDNDYEEIPAFEVNGTKKVFHLFSVIRTEQTIGFTQFAAGLKDYQDLDKYREAEIMAAMEAACLTGFVKSQNPEEWQVGRGVGYSENADASGTRRTIHEFSPGEWHYLNPYEDVEVFHPNRPNEIFGQFTEQLLAGPANALDIPPEILTQNWKGMNYSNARTVLLQFYLTCFIRRKYLLDFFCSPVYENVARQMIAMGRVKAGGYARRPDDYMQHTWITPGWAWVDPVKEAQGKEIELENNMETLGDIAASKGRDWEDLLEQRARELKKKKDLEEAYGIEFNVNKEKRPVAGDTENGEGDKETTGSKAIGRKVVKI